MGLKKILIIDDSVFDRLIAKMVLQKNIQVNDVIVLESAQEGLDYISDKISKPTELPEIILLDIKMPKIDGFEFLERFAKLPKSVKSLSKIFMLSSSIDPEDIKKAKKSKYVTDFIEKPLTKEKIENLAIAF
ncbi:hypothetical protein FLJC2902T_19530 [Flavobacterium limnosediminis JC2902]|uniref:Response regulatory domain-containing protein n=1 Tax=Flavobacterium limnosediminis JC2902 TaxID=1341181 RepID=V6ST25_9FLAO|nr:response regulator [Flavobacterium limnosediminis]ESU27590.1 hypothetical protein FLJC2902T_19530 [Flavobacterium limnosediminis JC2902]